MIHGSIFLIPTPLGDSHIDEVVPAGMKEKIAHIRHYAVEDLRTARRFLKKLDRDTNIDSLTFYLLNEHSKGEEVPDMMSALLSGQDLGLMSEAGTPCVADPGALLVAQAHTKNIRVIPLTGPSSITMALMASGFNGQRFAFHGYLPIDMRERKASLKKLEQDAFSKNQTQIFIETPYRNMKMLESILECCSPETLLCIAANITSSNEMIRTLPVAKWKKQMPAIHKQPAVFLLYKY